MGPTQFEFHFPEEVWEQILDELTEDEDRMNCCLASSYLDWILTKGKPLWLFKKILPSLFEYVDIHNDIPNCRRASSQWCSDIDDLIQSKRTNPQSLSAFPTWYDFDSQLKLDLFLEQFSNHHSRNPFLDRTVYISADNPDPPYLQKLNELFDLFGRHIWMLQISPEFIRTLGRFQWHNFLQSSLKNMPNLRKLTIFDGNHHLSFSGADNDLILNIYGHYFRNTNTIPAIPSLEFSCCDQNTPDSAQSILISSNIGQLQVQGISRTLLENMETQKLPSKLFDLELLHSEIDDSLELDERRLQLTSHINKFKIGVTHSSLSIMSLLKILRNFPSIKEVSIYWSTFMDGYDPSTLAQVENNTVSSLTIAHRERFSYNFLRVFRALEVLTVDFVMPPNGCQRISESMGEDLQFYKILRDGQMYESNIWKVTPSLEHVKVYLHEGGSKTSSPSTTVISGNREDYEEVNLIWRNLQS